MTPLRMGTIYFKVIICYLFIILYNISISILVSQKYTLYRPLLFLLQVSFQNLKISICKLRYHLIFKVILVIIF